jgi:hypothetical protein
MLGKKKKKKDTFKDSKNLKIVYKCLPKSCFLFFFCPQEVAQSAGTTPNEADVTSSNPPPLVWICQTIFFFFFLKKT